MSGRRILITGASDGVGAAAARALSAAGDDVTVIGRNPTKTRNIAGPLGADSFTADFAELDQVRQLASDLNQAYDRIDVLINNAGAMVPERRMTVDGYELTFQANHLGPFLLTNLLLDTLVDSHASVITTASDAHRPATLDLDDLQLEQGWTPWKAYGRSKLANILFTRELHRRQVLNGLSAAAFHPGVVSSNFAGDATGLTGWFYGSELGKRVLTSPEKAADTAVWLAQGTPPRDWASGEYYVKRQIRRPSSKALDAQLGQELWQLSAELVGLPA